jgi:hypothetical protein
MVGRWCACAEGTVPIWLFPARSVETLAATGELIGKELRIDQADAASR